MKISGVMSYFRILPPPIFNNAFTRLPLNNYVFESLFSESNAIYDNK